MLRSNPPSRGETMNHRAMTGDLRNQIQLWEDISVTLEADQSSSKNKTAASKRMSSGNSSELSSPNVVLRSTVA